MKETKKEIQYRYYEMPQDSPILALLGSGWIRPYGSDLDALHFHNYLEIGYCYDGDGDLVLDEDKYRYTNHSFSVIPANFPHNTVAEQGTKSRWEYLFVDVESFLNATYSGNQNFANNLIARINSKAQLFQHDDYKKMATLILDLMDLYRQKEELYLECAKGLLLALLIHIASLQPKALLPIDSVHSSNKAIMQALYFINKNYKDKIQISDIADACNLSETHFRRLFNQYLHMSPLAYINLVRIEAACKMLKTSISPIQDIAVACGFLTLPSFNRNFRELMGVTPGQWRKDTAYFEKQLEKQHIMVFNGWQ